MNPGWWLVDKRWPVVHRSVLAIVLAATTTVCTSTLMAQTPPPAAPAGNVDKGRQTFARVGCGQCHGLEAQGSPTTGPRLGPGALPYAAFARLVRAPRLQMPPYTETILPNAELADIYAFVQSRPKPVVPALLQQ